MDALKPFISKETMQSHYERHHQGYVDKTNELIHGTAFAEMSLEEVIQATSTAKHGTASHDLFNQACQVWNHNFFWKCLAPAGQSDLSGEISEKIPHEFGSVGAFKKGFLQKATGLFGSGWTWLVEDPAGKLQIENFENAQNPLTTLCKPLLVLDVWEHAYYLDYKSDRKDFVKTFWDHVNWGFVNQNLRAHQSALVDSAVLLGLTKRKAVETGELAKVEEEEKLDHEAEERLESEGGTPKTG